MDTECCVLSKTSKLAVPPKPLPRIKKVCEATDFILKNETQEPDHSIPAINASCQGFCFGTTLAQNLHQGTATEDLRQKPIPKPRRLKAGVNKIHNNNVSGSVAPTSVTCSDRENNDPSLGYSCVHTKTSSNSTSKRVPPSIPVPSRPLPKEPELIPMTVPQNYTGVYVEIDTTSTQYPDCSSLTALDHRQSGSEFPSSDKPLSRLSSSKGLKVQDKINKQTFECNKVGSVNGDIVRKSLVSELHKVFLEENNKSEAPRDGEDCSVSFWKEKASKHQSPTQKRKIPQLELCLFIIQNKTLRKTETLENQNKTISGLSEEGCPEDMSVIQTQQTDNVKKLSKPLLETRKTGILLPLPGLVDKPIQSTSKKGSNFLFVDTEKKQLENLWQERSIVRNSGILSQLSSEQVKLQEHLYEVVTSERSYLKNLAVAVDHFQESPALKDALAPRDRKSLFSSIAKIKEISESFLNEILLKLDSSLYSDVLCDVVHQYALGPFGVYIDYIRNMPYQEQTLHNLGKESPQIVEILQKLQEDPQCNRLPLKAFLVKPLQRITQIKALMESIHKKSKGSACEASALKALTEISKVLEACNREVNRMKQMEELVQVANKIEYECKALPLVSSSRWLMKQGELAQVCLKENTVFYVSWKLCPILLLLFNDLLLVATKKLDRIVVKDYVHRSLIDVTEGSELEEELDRCDLNRVFKLDLLHNYRRNSSQLLLQTSSKAERDDWVELLRGRRDGKDKVYEEWDCPQVRCIQVYNGQQRGELSLQPGDTINVLQKTNDGFFEGRRVRDGQRGWFSAACVKEIANEHVQRRHIRQRHCVLQTATRILKHQNKVLKQRTTSCCK